MADVFIIIGIGAVAFIGTNLDNLLLLVAMHARYERQPGTVTAGYCAGMLVIGCIAALIGEVGEFIPLAWLGLLGVVPITMGVFALWKLFRKDANAPTAAVADADNRLAVFSTLLTTQLSNGTDTVIAFSTLLADSNDRSDYLLFPTFLAMIGVFSALAYYLLRHARARQFLSRYGQYVTPVILILVGVYIIDNTLTDLVPG